MKEDMVESKIIKLRGTANPFVGLEQSIALCDQLKKAVGKGPFDKDVAARGMNHQSASGPALGKIAALVHFGLLSRDGNTYSITKLADRILLPVSEDDRKSAILEAVNKPKLYKQLIEKYQSQALPTLFNNILVRDFGINEKRSNEVAKNFKKSLEFVGLLNNGVVSGNNAKENFPQMSSNKQSNISEEVEESVASSIPLFTYENSRHQYSLRRDKKILISYPQDFTLEEAKSIKSFAEYLISMRGVDRT